MNTASSSASSSAKASRSTLRQSMRLVSSSANLLPPPTPSSPGEVFFSNPHHSSSLPGRHEFLNSPPSPSMLKGNSPPDSPSILRGDCRPNRPPPPRHLRGLHRLSVAVQELPLWRRKENHGDSPPIRGDQGRPNRLQRLSIAVQVQNKHSTIAI